LNENTISGARHHVGVGFLFSVGGFRGGGQLSNRDPSAGFQNKENVWKPQVGGTAFDIRGAEYSIIKIRNHRGTSEAAALS